MAPRPPNKDTPEMETLPFRLASDASLRRDFTRANANNASSRGTAPTSSPAGSSGIKSAGVSKSKSSYAKPHKGFVDYAEAQIQEIQDKDTQIQSLEAQVQSKNAYIQSQDAHIRNQEAQIESQDVQIKGQDATITNLKARLAVVNHVSKTADIDYTSKATDAGHTSETTDADHRNEKTKAMGNRSNEETKATPQCEDKMDTDESGGRPARKKCHYGLTCRNTRCRFAHFDY